MRDIPSTFLRPKNNLDVGTAFPYHLIPFTNFRLPLSHLRVFLVIFDEFRVPFVRLERNFNISNIPRHFWAH